jgi:hypothetical protein
MYVLESVKKLKSPRRNQREVQRKTTRKPSKMLPDTPVRQLIYVDPETFKLRKIKMEDSVNSRNLNIDFSDFTPVEKQLYPGEIFMNFINPESNIQIRVKLAGFSMDAENEVRFKVPEKYTLINTK